MTERKYQVVFVKNALGYDEVTGENINEIVAAMWLHQYGLHPNEYTGLSPDEYKIIRDQHLNKAKIHLNGEQINKLIELHNQLEHHPFKDQSLK